MKGDQTCQVELFCGDVQGFLLEVKLKQWKKSD
jgi:hypothetical protein